jgi:RimJ/RimL family protein N-acetyltransferase
VKPLLTERLTIRNWEETDRPLFHLIHSDEQVMTFYPFRRSRVESDEIFDTWRSEIAATGLGGFALALRDSGECIGYCGLKYPRIEPILPGGTVEIGWRLAPRFWGNGYATEPLHGHHEPASFAPRSRRRLRSSARPRHAPAP